MPEKGFVDPDDTYDNGISSYGPGPTPPSGPLRPRPSPSPPASDTGGSIVVGVGSLEGLISSKSEHAERVVLTERADPGIGGIPLLLPTLLMLPRWPWICAFIFIPGNSNSKGDASLERM